MSPPTHAGKPAPSEVSVSDVAHPAGHVDVVRRGVHERLRGQPLAPLEGEATVAERGEHVGVPVRRGHDRDRGVVLGGGPHHRGAADVDLLDALVGRAPDITVWVNG